MSFLPAQQVLAPAVAGFKKTRALIRYKKECCVHFVKYWKYRKRCMRYLPCTVDVVKWAILLLSEPLDFINDMGSYRILRNLFDIELKGWKSQNNDTNNNNINFLQSVGLDEPSHALFSRSCECFQREYILDVK